MSKELIINAVLAGLWAGLAAFTASQELSKAALFAAVAVAVRAVIGYLANASGNTIPVDK
jgi:hypothetical protein